jgi:hypothetical protein
VRQIAAALERIERKRRHQQAWLVVLIAGIITLLLCPAS